MSHLRVITVEKVPQLYCSNIESLSIITCIMGQKKACTTENGPLSCLLHQRSREEAIKHILPVDPLPAKGKALRCQQSHLCS